MRIGIVLNEGRQWASDNQQWALITTHHPEWKILLGGAVTSPAVALSIVLMHAFNMPPKDATRLMMKLVSGLPVIIDCYKPEFDELQSQFRSLGLFHDLFRIEVLTDAP